MARQNVQLTICTGRRVATDDRENRRIGDPAEINKVLAANNGRLPGVDVSGLNLKSTRVPVVDYRTRFGAPVVRLRCV